MRGQRSRGGSGGKRPRGGRRQPPPDATGRERKFFEKHRVAGSSVVVHLIRGGTLEGRVGDYDVDVVTIVPDSAPPVQLRKDDIRYIAE